MHQTGQADDPTQRLDHVVPLVVPTLPLPDRVEVASSAAASWA